MYGIIDFTAVTRIHSSACGSPVMPHAGSAAFPLQHERATQLMGLRRMPQEKSRKNPYWGPMMRTEYNHKGTDNTQVFTHWEVPNWIVGSRMSGCLAEALNVLTANAWRQYWR